MSVLTATPAQQDQETALDRVRRMIRANPSVLPTIASVVIFVGMIVFG
jgi:simple sugar transport system permease protein